MAFLSQFREVEDAVICRYPETGKSRGFGFATFKLVESVKACLEANSVLDGRPLLAKLAADLYADFNKVGRSFPEGTGRRKLFIRNLADSTDSSTLHDEFEKFGEIEESVVVSDSDGKSRGYGFVTFSSPESSLRAVQQPQRVINGRIAFVSFAIPRNLKNNRDISGFGVDDEMMFRAYGAGHPNMQGTTYPSYPYIVDSFHAAANALNSGIPNSRGPIHQGRMNAPGLSQPAPNPKLSSRSVNGYYAAAQAAYLAQASQGSVQTYGLGYPPSSFTNVAGEYRGRPRWHR